MTLPDPFDELYAKVESEVAEAAEVKRDRRTCTACFGHGMSPRWSMTQSRFLTELETCYRCGGAGVVDQVQR